MVRAHHEYYCEKCHEIFDDSVEANAHENSCNPAFQCDKCNKSVNLMDDAYGFVKEGCHTIDLGRLGYGSGLDGSEVRFNLCDDCLCSLVDSLSWNGRAKVHNSGSNKYMSDDTWIRWQRGELSNEEKENLGLI